MNNATGQHQALPEEMLTVKRVSFIQFPFALSLNAKFP